MPPSRLTTLGGFAFNVSGVSTPGPGTHKGRALMAFVIMNRNSDAARERLLDIFWPDAEPDRARDSLKTALWSIRRCLRSAGIDADDFLVANKSVVRWCADTTVDATQFDLPLRATQQQAGKRCYSIAVIFSKAITTIG
jgi:DNA-binding SARP family transcriptional activator